MFDLDLTNDLWERTEVRRPGTDGTPDPRGGIRRPGRSTSVGEGLVHESLRGVLHPTEVLLALERLGVDLVDVLGAGGAGREPRRLGGHLQPADGASGGGLGDRRDDRLAGQLRRADLIGAERLELRLLLAVGRRIHAG